MKKRVSITLDEEVVKFIDKKRKNVPRSTYVNEIFIQLKGGKK